MTMLIEGGNVHLGGTPPSQEWLEAWVDRHGITHPVLADPDWTINQHFWGENPYPVPRTMLIKPGMEIVWKGNSLPGTNMIEENLP
ncbi:MAG: hypothetical protein B7733_18505 [Myxococcales bacterium FL481]|nr:MAG: hypothetical protein B7733_18505 [Myxococcales bacterium FL481]